MAAGAADFFRVLAAASVADMTDAAEVAVLPSQLAEISVFDFWRVAAVLEAGKGEVDPFVVVFGVDEGDLGVGGHAGFF